jgi:hypothetical protein
LDSFDSNDCSFRGYFKGWKVIVESDALRALTASDRDSRNPLLYACAGGTVCWSRDVGGYEQLERWVLERTMMALPDKLSGKPVRSHRNGLLGRIRYQLDFADPWPIRLSNSP